MSEFQQIREQAYKANMQLTRLNLVMFTFGNVSVLDPYKNVFAIKPSGVPYDELHTDKMVIVDLEGNVIEGTLRPSSDTLTHAVLYKHWKGIGSIVHTHSTYATAWAQAQRDIPVFGTTHADHLTVDIPCAAPMNDDMIAGNYELETGYQIINCFKDRQLDPLEVQMMLVGNHAPFAWGANSEKAVYHAAVLEEIARMAWLTESIHPNAPRLKEALIKKHYQRKHGPDAYYGNS